MKKKNKKNKHEESFNDKKLKCTFSPKRLAFIQISPDKLSPGQRVKRERILRGYSIDTMAHYLNISASYLGAIERGTRPISKFMLETIHERLDISYDYIQDGTYLSSSVVHDFARENQAFGPRHNIGVLVSVCSDEDAEACYQLIRSFLASRHQIAPTMYTKDSPKGDDDKKPQK